MNVDLESGLRRLREQAAIHVVRWPSREPIWTAVYNLTRGRIDRRPRYNTGRLPTLSSLWQDTDSGRYFGWRCRRANLNGGLAFVVEYVVCPHCWIGWVDKPHTIERYQRRGLAAAALRALRIEHAVVVWHTGSGHASSSKSFWAAVGDGVEGGYSEHKLCRRAGPAWCGILLAASATGALAALASQRSPATSGSRQRGTEIGVF